MPRKRSCCSFFFWLIALPVILLLGTIIGCNIWIVGSTQSRVYESTGGMESYPVGVLLGTTKNVGPDRPNKFFQNRITAAAELFRSGKIDQLLVSGHRASQYYDETRDMVTALVEKGVPESAIITDDKGSRTIESITRADSEYGFQRFVIISDGFHVNRALFIADQLDLEAVALGSESIGFQESRNVRFREYLARVKAVLDLLVEGKLKL